MKLPDFFDWRLKHPDACNVRVLNQRDCSSCVLISFSRMCTIRSRIHNLPYQHEIPYEIYKSGCIPYNTFKCDSKGIRPHTFLKWSKKHGIFKKCGRTPMYPTVEWPKNSRGTAYLTRNMPLFSTDWDKLKKQIEHLKKTIMEQGPVMTTIFVNNNINTWNDTSSEPFSVYKHKTKGRHQVVVLGWGTFKGKPAWLVQNTYGNSNGTCHIPGQVYSQHYQNRKDYLWIAQIVPEHKSKRINTGLENHALQCTPSTKLSRNKQAKGSNSDHTHNYSFGEWMAIGITLLIVLLGILVFMKRKYKKKTLPMNHPPPQTSLRSNKMIDQARRSRTVHMTPNNHSAPTWAY